MKCRLGYLNNWAGKRLLQNHTLESYGYWMVHGEGDESGYNKPFLGILAGRLDHVIDYAMMMKGFWSWGGGEIEKVNVIAADVNSVRDLVEKQNRIQKLEEELATLKGKL